MPRLLIVGCAFSWDVDNKVGDIEIGFQGNPPVTFNRLNAPEFNAIATVLNESPVFYVTETRAIQTNRGVPTGGN